MSNRALGLSVVPSHPTATLDPAGEPLAALRTGDRDRYLQVLLARSADRPALLALFLLNLELARIPDVVREPMAGLVRLQWWRDALAEPGPSPRHPVLALVAETGLCDRVGRDILQRLVDARERGLETPPLGDPASVEAHAAATAGALNAAAATAIGADAGVVAKARAIGTAYGLLGIVRALPFVVRRPGGTSAEGDEGGLPAALTPFVGAAVERAEALLDASRPLRGRSHAPVLALGLLARQDAVRLRRSGLDVTDRHLAERPPWTVARCLLARAIGKYD
jgi:phytoene/squalene synthetase